MKGVVASPGIAIGKANVLRKVDVLAVPLEARAVDVGVESERLRRAGEVLAGKLSALKELLPKQEQEILEAQQLMLESLVSEALELVSQAGYSAAYAVRSVYEKYSEMLKQGSELFALRAQDLRDLASRLVTLLQGAGAEQYGAGLEVAIGDEVDPIEFLELVNRGLRGLVTKSGGVTSHVAILARLKGVPYLIVSSLDLDAVAEGSQVIVDALEGYFIADPSGSDLEKYARLAQQYSKLLEVFASEARLEALTLDGHRVNVYCNVGSFEELRILDQYGCEGVGLFRVEFAYMARSTPPSEEELYELFSKSAQLMGGKALTVRAPDIGGDKPVPFLELPREQNPQLGLRGARLLFKYREELLLPLVRALLRASRHGRLRLMLPMVSAVEEAEEFRRVVEEERERLEASGVSTGRLELGVMVETPSSALLAGSLVSRGGLSFISFGTNDLTQYVLAADRGNSLVAYLYDELSPAVLRLIAQAVRQVKGRAEIEVCGEMASRPLAIPVLLGLGVESLSVAPQFVGRVKYVVRRLRVENIKREVGELLEYAEGPGDVREWSKKVLDESGVAVYE
ncbi:phosphoenolpyruvate--protein phosphotransferase [Infirmifilum lucidum]|uniref:Phosphoenolpyruvate-protein phosphotransferase n=1 Tax=Infirmifilum lucidum TaxID=2776706 RepID=A0A7L9FHG1_9CREN|nr:phosphoenolpyruvate--protein phosphotransferase [Infirmifilum lucidum]QOJ79240.1 phosphoenolpyruvate--protein phosphotransferase [Infirmifilum lucidum]